MNQFFLSHLLPYDPEIKNQGRLKDGLNEYLLLLAAAEEAMEAFAKEELNKFDPLVGENSCQIRAVKTALIASKKDIITPTLLDSIALSKGAILELLEKVSDPSIQDKSLKHFLESLNADVALCSDTSFLIKSYILTKTKFSYGTNEIMKFYKNEKTNPKLIKELGKVGSTFADNLIRHLRERLSKNSAEFVLDITKCPLLPEKNMGSIISDFSIDHRGLQCTPFYWMTKLIMHRALVSKIPIVVFAEQLAQDLEYEILKKATLFFQPTDSGYQVTTRDTLGADQPIIVFTVASCRDSHEFPDQEAWEKELTEHNLVDLVLACNAAHRQYPDPSQEHRILEIEDASYRRHLEKSREWGCHLENPSRFFLTHIYCESTKNI